MATDTDVTEIVVTGTTMLIDRYLPTFDATIITHEVIDADVARTWQALQDLDLMKVHTPLLDAAFYLRGLPTRVAAALGRENQQATEPTELTLTGDGMGLEGWLSLGQVPEREIAFGAIGRFWQADIEWYDVSGLSPSQFATFDEAGWGRIAANFSLRAYGDSRTLASYEARTATPDEESAVRFRRYWRLVRPFVSHIMAAALQTLKQDAQHDSRRDRSLTGA